MRSILLIAVLLSPTASLAAEPYHELLVASNAALTGSLACESRLGGKPVPSYKSMKQHVERELISVAGSDAAVVMLAEMVKGVEADVANSPMPPPPAGVTDEDMRQACANVSAQNYEALRLEGARYRLNAKTPPAR